MASFDPDADLSDDRAFQLLKNGPVTLFRRPEMIEAMLSWLVARHYQLIRLDAGRWVTEGDFHRAIASALDFPDYYGHNLNAFNDCMRDVAEYAYGARRDATGTVLAFSRFDAFAARLPKRAYAILDIIAIQSHTAMLIGHRMLCLVQSNDPDIDFDSVGASPVTWNPAEWMRANRR